jgi:hypothetical protein
MNEKPLRYKLDGSEGGAFWHQICVGDLIRNNTQVLKVVAFDAKEKTVDVVPYEGQR